MNDLNTFLINYINDPDDAENNFSLAIYYHNIGQTASAISFYIRTAERTEDDLLKYECLIKASMCFDSQGCRGFTVKGLLQHAIAILPRRPEAYYLLSRFYEREQKPESWKECYLIASIGHSVCNYKNNSPMRTQVDYPGDYAILFEKAVSSWWCGLCDESRELFRYLSDNYIMNEEHKTLVHNNLKKLNDSGKNLNMVYLPKKYESFDWGPTDDEYINLFAQENFINHIYEKHFSVQKNDIVVDLGSNCGSFTYSILEKNPKHVYCIEPSDEIVKALRNNTKNKPVTIINKAISDHNCERESIPDYGVYISSQNSSTYSTITFKSLIDQYQIKKIDFLKFDCEGGEYFVFTPENVDYIKNNIRNISGEFHITGGGWEDSVKYFKIFRDNYLKNLENSDAIHVYERCGKEVTNQIFDDQYLEDFYNWWSSTNPYLGQFIVYLNCEKAYGTFISPTIEEKINLYSVNKSSNNTCWIVENFYEHPDEVRTYALEQDYEEGGFGRGYIGRRTHQQFLFPGIKEKIEATMGKKITKWEEYGMNGRFQITWAGEPLVYHCDAQQWAGMIYLTPNAPYQCGTTLYAHKQTRARTYNDDGWDAGWKDIPGDAHLDGTPFEPVDVIGNVYNRLVIFDASCIHSASEYFGTVKENARLFHMFFFDAE